MPTELGLASRVWEYLQAAGIYWWAALAMFTAAERHAERLFPRFWKARVDPWLTPSKRKWGLIILAALAFLVGNFRAFDEQRVIINSQKIKIDQLTSQLDQSRQRSSSKERLQQFYVDVGPIIGRPLQKGMPDDDFNKYVDEAQAWVDNTANWIEKNMGIAARERFLDRTGMLATSYSLAINNQHNTLISNLTRLRQNLRELIESSAWDKP